MVENGNARIVRECWLGLPDHYPHVSLDAFVVMPDHVHGIIVLLHVDGVDSDTGVGSAFWAGLKPAHEPQGRPGSPRRAQKPTRPALRPGSPRLATRPYTPKRSNVFLTSRR